MIYQDFSSGDLFDEMDIEGPYIFIRIYFGTTIYDWTEWFSDFFETKSQLAKHFKTFVPTTSKLRTNGQKAGVIETLTYVLQLFQPIIGWNSGRR